MRKQTKYRVAAKKRTSPTKDWWLREDGSGIVTLRASKAALFDTEQQALEALFLAGRKVSNWESRVDKMYYGFAIEEVEVDVPSRFTFAIGRYYPTPNGLVWAGSGGTMAVAAKRVSRLCTYASKGEAGEALAMFIQNAAKHTPTNSVLEALEERGATILEVDHD